MHNEKLKQNTLHEVKIVQPAGNGIDFKFRLIILNLSHYN